MLHTRFVLAALLTLVALPESGLAGKEVRLPNVIVILADDMGFGDAGYRGHPAIKTPNLDRMASEGQQWDHFYAAASVCSPSRAGLLTGRLPIRSGIASSQHRVFFPWSKGGIQASEFTLAELFKSRGYQTAMIGKWHLGHLPEFLPNRHGFNTWFGIPYSNDMDKTEDAKLILNNSMSEDGSYPPSAWYHPQSDWFQIPLMQDDVVKERAPDQRLLTQRYTERSLHFIRENSTRPFFLYLAFSMPHVPLFRSPPFEGRSEAGLYGDVIEELDAAVGQILDEIRTLDLEQDTWVVFTSDNGPWLKFGKLGGSAGNLRDGKSSTWEGGFRVPALFWAPGTIPPRVVQDVGSTLDLMATFSALTEAPLPNTTLDSFNLLPALTGNKAGPRRNMYFYLGDQLSAIRSGPFKVHFSIPDSKNRKAVPLADPLLYDLINDPSEQHDLSASKPEVIRAITRLRDAHLASRVEVENQLNRR